MRDEDDTRLSVLLARLLGEQLDRVLVNPDWDRERDLLIDELEPVLLEIALREARREARKWEARRSDPLFDKVVSWAKSYAFELVTNINVETRKGIAAAIEEFATTPETMGELREKVASLFSPERANRIAVTEVTRAYTEGGRIEADELRETGLQLIDIWRTENDSLVCEDCDHEGEAYGEGWTEYPPVHPNCRCSIERELA